MRQILGATAEVRFHQEIGQAGRDTLLNIYYLLTSDRVAGPLWPMMRALRWAERNQLGIEADDAQAVRAQLQRSGNFLADGWLTCRVKNSRWSLRQVRVGARNIFRHGLQVYQLRDDTQPHLLVVDIDTIVFSALHRWPRHAFDIIWPDAALNDPLRARRALTRRGIFPDLSAI